MSRNRKPPRSFFERGTLTVARALIGMHLVHDDGRSVRAGRIVETEAYLGPRDLAAHSARGRTRRTEVMFGPAGHAYVYFIYGFWNCLNVVTGRVGVPHAVLLRALEPLGDLIEGTWGPGLLCRALNIDRRLNGADLRGDERPRCVSRARPASVSTTPASGRSVRGDSSIATRRSSLQSLRAAAGARVLPRSHWEIMGCARALRADTTRP